MSDRNPFKKRRSEKKNQRTKARNVVRKRENIERMLDAPKRSPGEQLHRLDKRLGKGVGAARERSRLGRKSEAA